MTQATLKDKELLDILKADPNSLKITKKVLKKPSRCTFFDLKVVVDGKERGINVIASNIVLTNGPGNPNDPEDYRTRQVERKSNSMDDFADVWSVETSVAQSSVFGELISLLDKIINDRLAAEKLPTQGNRQWVHMIKTHYSEKEEVRAEIRGKPRESPVMRFKLKFSPLPANYFIAGMRGKPLTSMCDANKPIMKDGRTVGYEPLVDDDGRAVDHVNAYKVLNSGAKLISARIHMDTLTISNMGVSVPMTLGRCVVTPSAGISYDDNELFADIPAEDVVFDDPAAV